MLLQALSTTLSAFIPRESPFLGEGAPEGLDMPRREAGVL